MDPTSKVYYLRSTKKVGPFKKGEVYRLYWGYHERDRRMCWGFTGLPGVRGMWSLSYKEDPTDSLERLPDRWGVVNKGIQELTDDEIWATVCSPKPTQ